MKLKVFLMPLVKGECLKQQIVDIEIDNYTNLTEIIDIVTNNVNITPFLIQVETLKKRMSVHTTPLYMNSHGPMNLCIYTHEYISKSILNPPSYSRFIEDIDKLYLLFSVDVLQPFSIPISISSLTPIIWLDIDGVVNIINYNERDKFDKFENRKIYGGFGMALFPIRFNPKIIERINRWSLKAEIRFMTSWNDFATYRFAPCVGLYPFAHNVIGKYELYDGTRGTIPHKEDLDRPLIWIDDELGKHGQMENALKAMKTKFKHITVINTSLNKKTHNYYGLTEENADTIDNILFTL